MYAQFSQEIQFARVHRIFSYYAYMNRKRFKSRSLGKTIELLAKHKGGEFLKKDGEVNQSAIGRAASVNASLISRLLRGETQYMDHENVKQLAKAFNVNTAQMRGEIPIPAIDGVDLAVAQDVIQLLYSLSDDQAWEILRHCQILAEKNNNLKYGQ